ncbi:hypothetical protein BST61_g7847 [Cercospora zeina]
MLPGRAPAAVLLPLVAAARSTTFSGLTTAAFAATIASLWAIDGHSRSHSLHARRMNTGQSKAKGRREQVANACVICRTAKLKCSGNHPTCSRCHERGLECQYDVLEGLTKRQQLQYDLVDRKRKLEHAMGILDHLQHSSDHEAAESLARLRIGASIEDEYRRIQACSPRSSTQRNPAIDDLDHPIEEPDKTAPTYLTALAPGMQNLIHSRARDAAHTWDVRGGGMAAQAPDNIDPQMLEESNTSYN